MMHESEKCGSCAAWFNDDDALDGEPGDCRRRVGRRSPVSADHWCFEFVPKVPVKCGGCWAWDSDVIGPCGVCRLNTPAVDHREDSWLFPRVKQDDWCLKGRRKP